MNVFIYDTEIKHGVVTDNNPAQRGYLYAKGWDDFAGMGIACLCGYDVGESRYRVFLDDNIDQFGEFVKTFDAVVSFNGHRFDDKLLAANGIPLYRSIDLAALIWRAAGIPSGEHPKGLGLDAICRANKLPTKTGNGADAPQDFQDGRLGKMIDYCLGDVRSTLHLYRYLISNGGIKDPRDGKWLNVALPL